MKCLFAGTPDFAATQLKALLASKHTISGVFTQPDRPQGRGRKLIPSAVKQVALDASLPIFQPPSLKEPMTFDPAKALSFDIMIVSAYGLILPQYVLDYPHLGCINIHASLLPKWRGSAPIHRAVLAGDKTSGITLMQMDAGLDTGNIINQQSCPIEAQTTSGELHDTLAQIGADMIVEFLDEIELGNAPLQSPQNDDLATYAKKLNKQEGRIDWAQSAQQIDRQIRGLQPWPIAFTELDEQIIRIYQAKIENSDSSAPPGTIINADKTGIQVQCGQGAITLQILQLSGKKASDCQALLNAYASLFAKGKQFI